MGSANSLLLLGSNLGDKQKILHSACNLISDTPSCEILKMSSIYETEPWGVRSKNSYLNQAVLIKTSLNPFELLEFILQTEIVLGRERNEQWEDRMIDIDILLYNDFIVDSSDLIIPHPHMINRRFSLIPACEIVAEWEHPLYHKSLASLLALCKDISEVKKI